jgi:NAD(P)-dependent dehydrogenase (short-subunit alcohol dehydrogenase family)
VLLAGGLKVIYVKGWLITGASRGLGPAFTEAVIEAGDRVVATARNPAPLRAREVRR